MNRKQAKWMNTEVVGVSFLRGQIIDQSLHDECRQEGQTNDNEESKDGSKPRDKIGHSSHTNYIGLKLWQWGGRWSASFLVSGAASCISLGTGRRDSWSWCAWTFHRDLPVEGIACYQSWRSCSWKTHYSIKVDRSTNSSKKTRKRPKYVIQLNQLALSSKQGSLRCW